jgi:hypothetical protein
MAIETKQYKNIFNLVKFLLNIVSWYIRYIPNNKIGLYETWLIKGVGSKILASLKGGISSNQIRYDNVIVTNKANKKAYT